MTAGVDQDTLRRFIFTPLNAEHFAPYGSVIEASSEPGIRVNQGRGLRHDLPVDLDGVGSLRVAAFNVSVSQLPLTVTLFERHPLSVQIFIPMLCTRYAVIVAPNDADGRPDCDRAEAFLAHAGQGLIYNRNVWHHPISAIDSDAQFTMMIREEGSDRDCVVNTLAKALLCDEPT